MTARLVDVQYQNLLDELPAAAADKSSMDAGRAQVSRRVQEAYHRQYHSAIRTGKSGRDADPRSRYDPRSIRFCITEVQAGLRAVSGTGPRAYANEAERLAGKLVDRLSYDRVEDIFEQGRGTSYLSGSFCWSCAV